MTLDEAIRHLKETLSNEDHKWSCAECKSEHEQLLSWLMELQGRREADIYWQRFNRWIPCNERMPEIGYNVLVTRITDNGHKYVRIATRQDDCWMDNSDEYMRPNPHAVLAWMPIPEEYKGDGLQ